MPDQDMEGRLFWPPKPRKRATRQRWNRASGNISEDPLMLAMADQNADNSDDGDDGHTAVDNERHAVAQTIEKFDTFFPDMQGARMRTGASGNSHNAPSDDDPSNSPTTNNESSSSSSSSSSNDNGSHETSHGHDGAVNSDVVVRTNHGNLRWYSYGGFFTPTCKNPLRGKCVLTRTSRASMNPRSEAHGRPLGLLTSWLEMSRAPTRVEHWDKHGACT